MGSMIYGLNNEVQSLYLPLTLSRWATSLTMKVFSHSIMDILWIPWPSGQERGQEMKNRELGGRREKLSTSFNR